MRSFFTRPWDTFFNERIERMIREKSSILDIGASLRIDASRGNRVDSTRAWMLARMKERKTTYRVIDVVDTYHHDLVGSIEDLPLSDASEEAIVCNAILEHVENPMRAYEEMYRVLAPGGQCFLYVPFLYYYHAERGYYSDYWRFTEDAIRLLSKKFSTIEIAPVRGPLETIMRLTPFGRFSIALDLAYLFDGLLGKEASRQVSGHYVFLIK